MKERGLFTNPTESSFVSASELKKKNSKKLDWITPLPDDKDYTYWSKRFKERQEQHSETKEVLRNHFELKLPERSLLAFVGDQHVGSPEVDYERIEKEVQAIAQTENAYMVLMGDTVDGFFFNPAQMEEMEQVPEQYEYIRSMVNYLGENNKLILAIGGDHDGWIKKRGFNALKEFTRKNNCFYSNGVTYLSIHIGDSQYRITAAHRFPGSSMYNPNHPQTRAVRFGEARGSDIVVSGHTHKKGIAEFTTSSFGNVSQKVCTISLGPYKINDEYARKLGLGKINAEGLYGAGVILNKKNKKVKSYYDIFDGIKDL